MEYSSTSRTQLVAIMGLILMIIGSIYAVWHLQINQMIEIQIAAYLIYIGCVAYKIICKKYKNNTLKITNGAKYKTINGKIKCGAILYTIAANISFLVCLLVDVKLDNTMLLIDNLILIHFFLGSLTLLFMVAENEIVIEDNLLYFKGKRIQLNEVIKVKIDDKKDIVLKLADRQVIIPCTNKQTVDAVVEQIERAKQQYERLNGLSA